MEAHSFRRMYSRAFKGLKRFSKAALLSAVTLSIFFSTFVPAHAQTTNTLYPDYENLFQGGTTVPTPTLSTYQLVKKGTTTTDLQFILGAQFGGIDPQGDTVKQKEDAWNHIDHSPLTTYPFIIRICNTSDTVKKDCYFAKIPSYTDENGLTSTTSGATGVGDTVNAIYYYGGDPVSRTTGNGTVNDIFKVLFPITDVAQFSSNGNGLDSTIPASAVFAVGDQNQYQADVWYCAKSFNNEALPAGDDPSDPNHRQFNNLCGNDHPYFKIASTTFQMPADAATAQTQTPGTVPQFNTTPTMSNVPSCGLFNGSILGCVAQIVYYLIYRPIAWFAGLLGELFDFFLGYSLNDASYRASFAVRGWQIVRDISNVFFIVILVWVGLSTVFKTNSNLKRVVPNLILNALLINFSLFATRVVIDLSNVTARVFYHSIHVCDGKCETDSTGTITNPKQGIAGYTPLSEKIMSGFNPQRIFNPNVLNEASAIGDTGVDSQNQKKLTVGSSEYAGYYIVVSLIAALIVFTIGIMFWKTAFFFLGRVIGLYLAMIFAPFAFLGRGNIPLVNKIKDLSWESWVNDLMNYAMLAPIFVFFLYIIYSLIESQFITVFTTSDSNNFFTNVLFIAIPMLIIYFMIKEGVDIAKNLAGNIGKGIQAWVEKATGVVAGTAIGVASGGIASVGRGTLGRVGTNLANSEKLREWSASKNVIKRTIGHRGVRLGEYGANASYDTRKITTKAIGQLGIKAKENEGITNFTRTSSTFTKGGVVGSIARKEKRSYKRMETYQLTGDLKAAHDAKVKAWDDAHIKAALDNWKGKNPTLANDDFSVNQEKNRLIQLQASAGNQRPKSADEINLERNTAYGKKQQTAAKRNQILGRVFGGAGAGTTPVGIAATSKMVTGVGATLAAVGGEYATQAAADRRVGANVGRLAGFEQQIQDLNAKIAPLQNWWLTGTPPPPPTRPAGTRGQMLKKDVAELNNLKAKLRSIEAKRDKLNEQLTK